MWRNCPARVVGCCEPPGPVSRAHPLATVQQTLPRSRPAAGLGALAPAAVLCGLYALAVVLLLASRVREFADESDNLLGGYLIARGERLYADYFSNHMPLPYYLAAIPSLLGANHIEQFRLFTDALLVAATLGIAWGLMYRRGFGWTVAGAWATITVFAHTVQWGEMLHAGTCAGFGLLAAGLLFYTPTPGRTGPPPVDIRSAGLSDPSRSAESASSASPGRSAGPGRSSPLAGLLRPSASARGAGLGFSGRDELILAAAVFVAVESELLSIYPVALLGLCYLAAHAPAVLRQRNLLGVPSSTALEVNTAAVAATQPPPANPWRLAFLILLPHTLVLLCFAAVGALGAFVYDAYQFNQTYYAQFVMNGSILGMLHDWEAQYRTYLLSSLFNPLGLEGCLVIANLLAAYFTARSRGPLAGAAYFLFVSLCRVRNGGPYYLAAYFSLSLVLAWSLTTLGALGWGSRWLKHRLPQQPEDVPREHVTGMSMLSRFPGASAAFPTDADGGSRSAQVLPLLGSLAGLTVVAVFLFQVARTYDFSSRPAYAASEQQVLQAVTSPGDRIFVAPYDPYLYLATARLPVSTYEFYFPWQAADPRSDAQILTELRQRRPAAIVFRQDELVNGQYLTRDWASHLQHLLDDERYAVLDLDPTLADVFVPAERLSEAQARLKAAGLAPP
jgi:hypothetical protein